MTRVEITLWIGTGSVAFSLWLAIVRLRIQIRNLSVGPAGEPISRGPHLLERDLGERVFGMTGVLAILVAVALSVRGDNADETAALDVAVVVLIVGTPLLVAVLMWLVVNIRKMKRALLVVAGLSVMGAILASLSFAATLQDNQVKYVVEGKVDVRLENWSLRQVASIPFQVAAHCETEQVRAALKDSIMGQRDRLKGAALVLVLGQVDRRRLNRPGAEWVRTDLELAQARADCAREIVAEQFGVPAYTLVGGPTYLTGTDSARLAADREVRILAFAHKVSEQTVELEPGRVFLRRAAPIAPRPGRREAR